MTTDPSYINSPVDEDIATEDETIIRKVVAEIEQKMLESETSLLFEKPIALVSSEVDIARCACEISLRRIIHTRDSNNRDRNEQRLLEDLLTLGAAKMREVDGKNDPEFDLKRSTNAIRDMLIQKNREYGSAVFKKGAVFSQTGPEDAIRIRLDDKLSRLAWMMENPGESKIQEDTEFDITGYLILMRVARYKNIESK